MKRIEYPDKIKSIELVGMDEMSEGKEMPELVLPRRYSHGTSLMHIPSSSQILERLYSDQGVRVRMIRRGRPNRIPTVKELIDHITKKHERLLEMEAKGNKLEKPVGLDLNTSRLFGIRGDTVRCASLTARTDVDSSPERVQYRCLSERPTRFEVWDPGCRGSLEVTGHNGKPHTVEEKKKKKLRLLMETTGKLPRDGKDIDRAKSTLDVTQFTLRELLLQKSKSALERSELTLPKLNVVEFCEDKDGAQGTNSSNTALLNMNQRLNQMKAQKELTSVQMYSQRKVRLRMTQNQRRQILPWFGSTVVVPQGLGSSSTPTAPYSTADILYGSEVNGSRGQQTEEGRQNSFGELERSRDLARSRTKELEQNPNNKRPSSRSGKQKALSIDSVAPFDKDREDPLRSLSSALPPTKPSHHFRPNGIRSNIVKSDQLYSSKTNGAVSGRDQDDLVAMGTLWSPNNNSPGQPAPPVASSSALSSQQQQQQQQSSNRNNSVSNSNTNSFPSKAVSSSSVNHSTSLSNNTLNTQRKYPGTNIRPIVVQNNVSGRKNSNSMKEQEDPKYTDPMIGAPASFQQRIIELGALEGDTVRWERTKRLKKKKQDRDS